MEALGAAGSALAVVGAARDLGKISYKSLKKLRDAPQELQELLDEASRLQVFFELFRDFEHDPCRDEPDSVHKLVRQGTSKLLELREVICYELTKPNEAMHVDRIAWTIHKTRVQGIVQVIRRVQQDVIGVHLGKLM